MTATQKIVFLLVNYFNEEEVCTFINEQLQPATHNFIDVVITDNGSKDHSLLQAVSVKYPRIYLVKADTNMGYLGAANLGLTRYLNTNPQPSAVIVCNTDIVFKNNFFDILQQKLASKSFDVLGPSIYSTLLKYYQNPYISNRISKSKLKFLHFVSSNYVLYSLFTVYHLLKTKLSGRAKNSVGNVAKPYAVHGSFMIFKNTFFKKGGTLNYPSVLFGEELFIAEQARVLGLGILYEPALQVEHHEHTTTGVFKSRETVRYLNQSYSYLLKTYFK